MRVDDMMPAVSSAPVKLQSAQIVNGAYWMPVLEKAMAKMLGNYSALIGGTGAEAMGYLTGFPTDDTVITSSTQAISYLKAVVGSDGSFVGKDMITIQSKSSPTSTNLVAGHVYGVKSFDATTNTMVVHNPWGSRPGDAKPEEVTVNLSTVTADWAQFARAANLGDWFRSYYLIVDDSQAAQTSGSGIACDDG